MLMRRMMLTALMLAGLALPAAAQTDVKGAADHPGIPRYEGSWILGYDSKSFAAFDLPTGPAVKKDGKWTGETSEHLEGQTTRLLYVAPEGRSTLEVFRNYEDALKERGFEILFSCSGADCGRGQAMGRNILWTQERKLANAGDVTGYALTGMKDDHYLAARKGGTSLALYVAQNDFSRFKETYGRAIALVDAVDTGDMESRMVDADAMAQSIAETGRVALNNVEFDFGKATLRPESAGVLAEMGKFLTAHPDISVYIVGHTDSVGGYEANMALSQARAAAVADALVSAGIARNRVVPAGVGPLAPLASNATEDGRARNRRVELVQR